VKRIALNLDSTNIGMKLQVMRLLAGICLLDDSGVEDGHKYVYSTSAKHLLLSYEVFTKYSWISG